MLALILLAAPLFAQVSDTPREDPERAQLAEDLRRAREEYAKDPHKYDLKPARCEKKVLEDLGADWEIVRAERDALGGLVLWVKPEGTPGGGTRIYRPDALALAKTVKQRAVPEELAGETFEAPCDDDAFEAVDYALTAARYKRAFGKKYAPPDAETVMMSLAGDVARGAPLEFVDVDLKTVRATFAGALEQNGEPKKDWWEGFEKTVASMNDAARKDDGFKKKLRVRRRPDIKAPPGYFELYDAGSGEILKAYDMVPPPFTFLLMAPVKDKKK